MKAQILVVGAGPVGLSAALALVLRGYKPRIIDKGTGPTPIEESRALAINLRTLDIFEKSGLSDDIRAVANKITGMRMVEGGKTFASLGFSDHPRKDTAIWVLPQGRTERLLLARLEQHGISPEWNTELVSLQNIETKPVAVFRKNHTEETFSADIVIGCDGAHSTTRGQAKIEFKGQQLDSIWGLTDVVYKTPIELDKVVINFLPNGAFGMFPLDRHTYRYVSNHPDVKTHIVNPDDVEKLGWQSTFKISFRLVGQFSKGKVFLAGDAAHVHSPAGGRGMNLGMEDAAWLAWLIEQGRTDQYNDDRMPTARQVLKKTLQQTRLITNANPLQRVLRRYLPPLLIKFKAIRIKTIHVMTAQDTPTPPWLD